MLGGKWMMLWLLTDINQSFAQLSPLVLNESSSVTPTYMTLAQSVAEELVRLRYTEVTKPIVFYDERRGGLVIRVFENEGAQEVVVSPKELRLR